MVGKLSSVNMNSYSWYKSQNLSEFLIKHTPTKRFTFIVSGMNKVSRILSQENYCSIILRTTQTICSCSLCVYFICQFAFDTW